ncbi:MAG TPA: DUF4926 domain-containing protein [Armatimonadota bacterium]|jgi:hypothetical protein
MTKPSEPIRVFDEVALLEELVAHDSEGYSFRLRPGDEGVCVFVHSDGMVDVEFVDGSGDPLCVKTILTSKVRRIS